MSLPYSKTVIVIPTYNEIENIEKMIQKVFFLYPEISLLIIDDGSPDGTAATVLSLMNKFSKLFIVERLGKLGLGTAYIAGFKWALERDFDFIFEMDCDFSHDPGDVAKLLDSAQTNDLVIGSRYKDGIRVINWPFKRLLLSYYASIYNRFVTGIPVFDTTGGFKCFSRKALSSIDLNSIISNGYIFQLELNYKVWLKGLKLFEVPIIFYERKEGRSKMGKGIIVEAIFNVLRLKFYQIVGKLD